MLTNLKRLYLLCVWLTLMQLNKLFCNIHVKVWDLINLHVLQKDTTIIIFNIFKNESFIAFFDMMTHLALHMIEELMVCKLVHF
jgi:hypothetical protein